MGVILNLSRNVPPHGRETSGGDISNAEMDSRKYFAVFRPSRAAIAASVQPEKEMVNWAGIQRAIAASNDPLRAAHNPQAHWEFMASTDSGARISSHRMGRVEETSPPNCFAPRVSYASLRTVSDSIPYRMIYAEISRHLEA